MFELLLERSECEEDRSMDPSLFRSHAGWAAPPHQTTVIENNSYILRRDLHREREREKDAEIDEIRNPMETDTPSF